MNGICFNIRTKNIGKSKDLFVPNQFFVPQKYNSCCNTSKKSKNVRKWNEKKTICQLSKGSFSDDLHILNQDFAIAPSAIKLPHVCNWQDPHPTRVISIQIDLSFFVYGPTMTNVWQKCKKSLLCSISTLFLLGRWWLSQNTANA